MHQQVCISLWHHASEGGGTPSGPGALQRRLPREAQELPQHRQPLTGTSTLQHVSPTCISNINIQIEVSPSVKDAFTLIFE